MAIRGTPGLASGAPKKTRSLSVKEQRLVEKMSRDKKGATFISAPSRLLWKIEKRNLWLRT
jgi:hypothetical protein